MADQKRTTESNMDLVPQNARKMRLSKENLAISFESSIMEEDMETESQRTVRTETKKRTSCTRTVTLKRSNSCSNVAWEELNSILGGRISGSVVAAPGHSSGSVLAAPGHSSGSVLAAPSHSSGSVVAAPGHSSGSVVAAPGHSSGSVVAAPGHSSGSVVAEQVRKCSVTESTVSDTTAVSDEDMDLSSDVSIRRSSDDLDSDEEMIDLKKQLENIVEDNEKGAMARLLKITKSRVSNITGNGIAHILRKATEHCSRLSKKIQMGRQRKSICRKHLEQPQKKDSATKLDAKNEEDVSDQSEKMDLSED